MSDILLIDEEILLPWLGRGDLEALRQVAKAQLKKVVNTLYANAWVIVEKKDAVGVKTISLQALLEEIE